jgi:predicted transcriptional regulator
MSVKQNAFGSNLRGKRTAKGYSLRKFADLVGVSATYLSQVEQGNADPPTARRVQKMAEILGQNADELVALAGRVPDDLLRIMQEQPGGLAAFLREAGGLSDEQFKELASMARKLKAARREQS